MELHPLKLILVISNFSTLSFLVLLMVDHYKEQNNVASWAAIFNIFSFLWLSLRGLFWLFTITSTTEWAAWKFYLLYWMPTPLEFGALMILPFYFAQVINSKGWKWHWGRWIQIVYSLVLVSLIIFQALWASQEGDGYQTEFKSDVFRCVTALCFFILTVTQSIYGVQLLYLDKQRYDRYFITSREVLAVVNAILVVSFLSRCVYQLLALFQLYTLPTIRLQGTADVPVIIFVVHEFWNYVPTVLLIVTITSRSIQSKFTHAQQTRGGNTYIDDRDDDDGEDSDDAAFIDRIELGVNQRSTRSGSNTSRGLHSGTSPYRHRGLESDDPYNSNQNNNSMKDAWLCDSDPQKYCLTSNLYFNQIEANVSNRCSSVLAARPASSTLFSPHHVDTMNTSTVRGSRSGSAGTSYGSSGAEGDPLLANNNNNGGSSSNHSLQQERNNLFAYYQFQKVRADSLGSYGSLNKFKLNKFNLAMSNDSAKHHCNPLLSRLKPGPLPSIMDLTTCSDTDPINDYDAIIKNLCCEVELNEPTTGHSRLVKEYELQVEPVSASSNRSQPAAIVSNVESNSTIITNPTPLLPTTSALSHHDLPQSSHTTTTVTRTLVNQAVLPLRPAASTTHTTHTSNITVTTTTVNPRPTRPTPFVPFGSAYAVVESPPDCNTAASLAAFKPHNISPDSSDYYQQQQLRNINKNNNNDSNNNIDTTKNSNISSSNNNTMNNNSNLLNRSRTPGLSPKPPFFSGPVKQHPLDNATNNINTDKPSSTSSIMSNKDQHIHQEQQQQQHRHREKKTLVRRESEAII